MSVAAVNPGPLSLISAALQARLQIAFPPEFFQFEILPARLGPDEWERLVRRTPFIGLGWTGITPEDNGTSFFKGRSGWVIFAVVKNQTGDRGRYLGDAQGVGLFQVLQAAVAVVNGFKIPGVATCMVTKVDNAYAEGWKKQDIAMGAIDVEALISIGVSKSLTGPEASPSLLTDIATSWVFAPGTEVVISDTINLGGSA